MFSFVSFLIRGTREYGGRAYIGEVLDNVVKVLGLFKLVVELLDGFAADEVLGDLGPGLGAAGRGRRAADGDAAVGDLLDVDFALSADATALVDDMHAQAPLAFGGGAQLRDAGRRHHRGLLLALGDELGATHAAVLLPRHLGSGAAGAVHAHALSSRGNVDDGPVLGDAVPRLAHLAAGVDPAGDLVRLVIVVFDGRRSGRVGAAPPGDAPLALNVDMQVLTVRVDEHLVLEVQDAAGRPLARSGTTAGMGMGTPADVDFGLIPRGDNVDLGVTVAATDGWGRRRAGYDHAWKCVSRVVTDVWGAVCNTYHGQCPGSG